jgi:glycosyltransferase involved in cell wall biosynthesis
MSGFSSETGVHMNRRPEVLVITHNFPRYTGDVSAPGFMPLFKAVNERLPLHFVVPHDKGLKTEDEFEGLPVTRFQYAPDSRETLAYRGNMHTRVVSHPVLTWRLWRRFINAGRAACQTHQPRALWAHWWLPGGMVAARLAQQFGLPMHVACHGTDIALLRKMKFLRGMAAGVFRNAASVTVVSSYLRQTVIDAVGRRVPGLAEKIHVIPLPANALFFEDFDDENREAHRIVAATRYTRQKRHDVLIAAAKRLRQDGVLFEIDLYGQGPEREYLQQQIDQLSLADSFHLHDSIPQPQLAAELRKAGISLLVSENEGFGLSLVEGMLCGCAVIGARSGGIVDIIEEDGRDGLCVPPGDIDALYGALHRLLTESELRSSIAARGRESASRRFALQTLVEQYSRLLRT